MKQYIKAVCSFILIGLFTGCTGNFDDMNVDPYGIVNPNPAYILPFIQETGAHVDSWPYQVGDNLHSQLFCQYFSNTTTSFSSGRYGYNNAWVTDGYWTPYYTVLKHTKITKGMLETNPSYSNIYQIMRIVTASFTATATDTFGDIPYFTASEGNSQSAYDSQKDIYYDIFKELTEAAEILAKNIGNITQEDCSGNKDIIYGGDIQKWIKFANSLRLRYALRLSFVDPAKAKAEGEAALKGLLLESNEDNAGVLITGNGNYGHPLYQISGWDGFCMSKAMENIFKNSSSVSDPRMPLLFGQARGYVTGDTEKQFGGTPNGMSVTEMAEKDNLPKNNSYCWGLQVYPDWNSRNVVPTNYKVPRRMELMNYAEVCLLKAEAALKGWAGAGDAKTNYENGIRASFEAFRTGVDATLYSTSEDETYITSGSVQWNETASDETKLKQIITQKWIALYPNGNEAWAEFRRTGYPELIPVLHSEESSINPANGEFIKKIRYVDDEIRENPNASDPSLNQNQGDGMNVRVWWDTKRYK